MLTCCTTTTSTFVLCVRHENFMCPPTTHKTTCYVKNEIKLSSSSLFPSFAVIMSPNRVFRLYTSFACSRSGYKGRPINNITSLLFTIFLFSLFDACLMNGYGMTWRGMLLKERKCVFATVPIFLYFVFLHIYVERGNSSTNDCSNSCPRTFLLLCFFIVSYFWLFLFLLLLLVVGEEHL